MGDAKLSFDFTRVSYVVLGVVCLTFSMFFHTAVSCRTRKCSKTRFVCFYKWRLDVSLSHFKNFESRTRKCFCLPKNKILPPLLKAPHSVAFTFPLQNTAWCIYICSLLMIEQNPNEINKKKTSND